MIKFIGIAICTLFCAMFIREYNKTFAAILSLIGVTTMFLLASNSISVIINQLLKLSQNYSYSYNYIELMLKVLGITLISQFISDLCRENGEIALSSVVLLISKVTVIIIILPLFEAVLNIIIGLVK